MSVRRDIHVRSGQSALTPRQRVEVALRGGHVDRVPFTIYESMVKPCPAGRAMRNRGMCIVNRCAAYAVRHPNVRETHHGYWRDGKRFIGTVYETPVGELSTLSQDAGYHRWRLETMFKSPEDYKAILFYLADERYEPEYERFAELQKQLGEDAICRAGIGSEPLQQFIGGDIMSAEDFCVQWMENRDEILTLYDAVVANRRKVYPIVAASPASHANYGGNVVPEIVGLANFEKYYVPHYNEAAEVMHKHGKLVGSHFDANCSAIAEAIAGTGLDYVEAFTPSPDTDMTLGEARRAWRGKVLWINFPSSLHLKEDEHIVDATVTMLEQLDNVDGLIMGITEDMPADRWQSSCTAIMDGLDKHAELQPGMYN